MKPVISDSVVYVGADDHAIDLFESQYPVPNGVSYNSYVILDEKIAVMDTVDRRATDEWLENVETALAGRKPDYLVVSHLEPDHSYNIALLCDRYPKMKLVGNAKTFSMLPRFFDLADLERRQVLVAEGESLSLGKHTLTFYMAPMVHWPEVMVSYESAEKLLFSADGFGKFGALDADEPWEDEARRYYINIVGKYGAPVQALLKKAAGLDIAKILPLHGPILEGDLSPYLEKYQLWSSYTPEESGVAICFCTIHGNTGQAAQMLREMLEAAGAKVAFFDLARCDMSQAVAAAFQYDRLVLAAPTYDAGLFPPMEDFLAHLKSKALQKRTVGLIENGSWAVTAGKLMAERLAQLKDMTVLEPTVTVASTVTAQTQAQLLALAQQLAK